MEEHNRLRNKLGTKDSDRKKQSQFGEQVDMLKMEWDECLEASAQWVADQCKKYHLPQTDEQSMKCRNSSKFNPGEYLGENLYMAGGYKANRDVGNTYVKTLYKEVKLDDWKHFECHSQSKLFTLFCFTLHFFFFSVPEEFDCLHFTQIVWHDSRYLGCAQQKCTNKKGRHWTNFVCRYAPCGNWVGELPFETIHSVDPEKICTGDLEPDFRFKHLCVEADGETDD